jgi:hypothetical protein
LSSLLLISIGNKTETEPAVRGARGRKNTMEILPLYY